MKTKLLLSVVVPAAMIFATSVFAEKKEEKIQWVDVPPAVQKTITDHAGGGKIEEVEKETKMHGGKSVTIYEAEVKKPDGKEIEIKVAEDGKLIKVKHEKHEKHD